MKSILWIIQRPGTLSYQVCKDDEELSVAYCKLEAFERVDAQLHDYMTRCQAWADQSVARDKYTHSLEAAIRDTIARADDHADSYISRPIRDALADFKASEHMPSRNVLKKE